MIDHYDWPGGREAMLRFGPDWAPVVLIALPLFEEANRTRAFTVAIQRALADQGLASAIPDLPGTGESLVPLEQARMDDWRRAFAAAADALRASGRHVHGAAIRGGALVDNTAKLRSRWHFASVSGAALLRDLRRAAKFAALAAGGQTSGEELDDPLNYAEMAGNLIGTALMDDLEHAAPIVTERLRTLRLDSDPLPADRQVEGEPLWRRSEPGNDLVTAAMLATDLAIWVRECDA